MKLNYNDINTDFEPDIRQRGFLHVGQRHIYSFIKESRMKKRERMEKERIEMSLNNNSNNEKQNEIEIAVEDDPFVLHEREIIPQNEREIIPKNEKEISKNQQKNEEMKEGFQKYMKFSIEGETDPLGDILFDMDDVSQLKTEEEKRAEEECKD